VSTGADKGASGEDDGAFGRGGVAGHGSVYVIGAIARVRGDGGLARVRMESNDLFLDPGSSRSADERVEKDEDWWMDPGSKAERVQGDKDGVGWCWMDVDDDGMACGNCATICGAVSEEWDVGRYEGIESIVVDHG